MVRGRGSRVGVKRERVTFQAPTTAADGYGGTTITWATVEASVAAAVAPELADEGKDGRGTAAVPGYRVTVWYSDTLAAGVPAWRVVWGGKTLEVQGWPIDETGRRLELVFRCRAVAS